MFLTSVHICIVKSLQARFEGMFNTVPCDLAHACVCMRVYVYMCLRVSVSLHSCVREVFKDVPIGGPHCDR